MVLSFSNRIPHTCFTENEKVLLKMNASRYDPKGALGQYCTNTFYAGKPYVPAKPKDENEKPVKLVSAAGSKTDMIEKLRIKISKAKTVERHAKLVKRLEKVLAS